MEVEEDYEERRAAEEVIKRIKERIKESQEVDLAFLLDATGSMKPFIEGVKEKIVAVAKGVKAAFPDHGKLRVACAFYRDFDVENLRDKVTGMLPYELSGICCNFTSNVDDFQSKLAELKAWGGDDDPEDVFSGLQRLLELQWAAPHSRLLFHIADAPCHGRRFHDHQYKKSDKYASGDGADDREGRKIEDILMSLASDAKISSYTFLHIVKAREPQAWTVQMMAEFKRAMPKSKEKDLMKIVEHTVRMPTTGVTGSAEFTRELGRVMESVSSLVVDYVKDMVKSKIKDIVCQPVVDGDEVAPHVDTTLPDDWADASITRFDIFILRYQTCDNVEDLLDKIRQGNLLDLKGNTRARVSVRVAKDPFTNSCRSRLPYYGQVSFSSTPMLCVIKKFKSSNENMRSTTTSPCKNPYLDVMNTHAIASQLATTFNQLVDKLPLAENAKLKLRFDAKMATCMTLKPRHFYTLETFYSDTQWVEVDNKHAYHDTLQAFSHWTHVVSEGVLLVVVDTIVQDKLGGSTDVSTCTDPIIHSKEYPHWFKRTNKQDVGIQLFYNDHKCNNICQALLLADR